MIVVATNQKTGERIEFPLLKLAAVHAGVKRTSMSYRVKTGHVDNNGWTYTERVLTKKEMTKRQLLYLKQKEATKQKAISDRKRERFAKRPTTSVTKRILSEFAYPLAHTSSIQNR